MPKAAAKKEFDFSKAEQGKFYRPIEELEIPVYLDKEIKAFYSMTALKKNTLPPNTYRQPT